MSQVNRNVHLQHPLDHPITLVLDVQLTPNTSFNIQLHRKHQVDPHSIPTFAQGVMVTICLVSYLILKHCML